MSITEEMKSDPRFHGFFRTVDTMLVEARRKRKAGEIVPMRRYAEFSSTEDYDNRMLMEYWK